MRSLLLGGTTEASALARLLAAEQGCQPMLSLAGRTVSPRLPSIPYRVGGFGGATGLAAFLRSEDIRAVIDATHPYAVQISANAVHACRDANVPLASLVRAPWQPEPGDRWLVVPNVESAVAALGPETQRVFLSMGRLELAAFRAAPQHRYLIRTIDPPGVETLPAGAECILARGPFGAPAELQLLRDRAIDILVTKNSGGAATYAKIAAARQLKIPVIMIARPGKPAGAIVEDAPSALAWLRAIQSTHAGSASERGV